MKKISWALSIIIIITTAICIRNNREENPYFLEKQFTQIEAYFEKRDAINPHVSQASVAWHLDHILKTINRIVEVLAVSNPEEYISRFNIKRIIVHTTGYIPRGVAQSPKSVRPPKNILLDSLRLQLQGARENMSKIQGLDKNAFFSHPVFNHLDRDQTRRFLKIHTNHHLKIIKDILDN